MRPPYRRRMIWCLVLALVVGGASWYLGVDVAHAFGIGGVIFAATACLSMVGDQAGVERAPEPLVQRDGSRRDVVQLGWALHTRRGTVAPEAVRRLRTLTAQALELHGLELDAPGDRAEIERVLGADVLRIIRRGSSELPRRATYASVLDRLDRLAAARPGPLTADAGVAAVGPGVTGPDPTGPDPTGPDPTGPVPTGPVPTGPVPTAAGAPSTPSPSRGEPR
ncbi:hypothetical protein GCM10009617_21570 [Leifsonia poae]|uniref:Uncharacterized protein n=1 Tax=Leifsonia poae TaxID=110933 RepID=A0A9W6HE78_9MICO|nr:hypothetical protein GCM10017584_37320 [Leifsonia poae]